MCRWSRIVSVALCFVTDRATTEIYTYGHTLSLHDALPICHTAVHGGLGHRAGNTHDQTRIKWPGNKVFGAERHIVSAVSRSHDFVLLFFRQTGDGMNRRHFHFTSNRDRKSTRLNSSH